MSNILPLIKKELLELFRTKKLLVLLVVFIFTAVASPVFAKLMPTILKSVSVPGMNITLPDPTFKDSVDQFIKNISQLVMLVLVFVSAGVVVDEKNKRTLDMVLAKPVSRSSFIVSKYIAIFLSLAVIFILSSIVFYIYTSVVFESFNFMNFSIIALASLLYMIMIASFTILASTLVKNLAGAIAIGFFGVIFFGSIVDLFESVKAFSPSFIFSNYKTILTSGWTDKLYLPIIASIVAVCVFIIISVLAFNKQEIER